MALLRIIAGDTLGATADIQAALSNYPSPELTRLAAEYFYDFGSLLRSAELFSLLTDESALSRQADALFLAGYADTARTIWTMLAALPDPAQSRSLQSVSALQSRALYNLAVTTHNQEESAALLDRLVRQADGDDPSRQIGLIRYSRLFDAPDAIALLNAERSSSPYSTFSIPHSSLTPNALIDLEILKRRMEVGEIARIVAETWLLVDSYPEIEELYQWAAWFFALQQNYTEGDMLRRFIMRHHFAGQWVNIHEALWLIREDNPVAAEERLRVIPTGSAYWTAAANLGRILEARHAPARALESYEIALAAAMELEAFHSASRIQVRIAHCLRSLGLPEESRRALEFALDLNPDNLNAHLELSRMR